MKLSSILVMLSLAMLLFVYGARLVRDDAQKLVDSLYIYWPVRWTIKAVKWALISAPFVTLCTSVYALFPYLKLWFSLNVPTTLDPPTPSLWS